MPFLTLVQLQVTCMPGLLCTSTRHLHILAGAQLPRVDDLGVPDRHDALPEPLLLRAHLKHLRFNLQER